MVEKQDQTPNFEKIIAQEVGNMGLDISDLSAVKASKKVSEVVGENSKENVSDSIQSKRNPKDSGGLISKAKAVSALLFKSNLTTDFGLPTPEKQILEVKKAIASRTRELVNQATKLEKSKNYSAAKMERLMRKIRHLRSIMSQLMDMTRESLEVLYRKYIWKQ